MMPLKHGIVYLALGILCPTFSFAGSVMTLKGTVFSVMKDEYVVQAGKELFHLKKEFLAPDLRQKLDQANTREITVEVPLNAIIRVRSPKTAAPPKPTAQ